MLLLLAPGPAGAQQTPPSARVTPLMTKALADYPGNEILMLTVEYPPSASTPYIAIMRMVSSTSWRVRL
jgi:hypothetical protein